MNSAFNRFESRYIIQFKIPCKNLSMKESMSRLRTSKIRMLSQTHGMTSTSDSQNQKSHYCSGKSVYSSSGKGERRTYSAHFLLIIWLVIRPTVTFWHSLRTSRNKNCFMACDAILFVSRLIQKCFRRKFLHTFVDALSLHICFCTDSFQPLGWIMLANVWDVFLRHKNIYIYI